jgi:hypothetical protein
MKTCRWHQCNKPFEATDGRQEFCCPACRKARGHWKAVKGAPLVDMLLSGDFAGLDAIRITLTKEIENETAPAR